MEIRDHVGILQAQRVQLSSELEGIHTLGDLIRWGFRYSPPREVLRVVVQDEFSHDVVVRGPGALYLSFDTT